MSQELYAKPAASVKTASYLVRLRGLPPQRLSMTHRALLAFLQQAGQRRAAAVAFRSIRYSWTNRFCFLVSSATLPPPRCGQKESGRRQAKAQRRPGKRGKPYL